MVLFLFSFFLFSYFFFLSFLLLVFLSYFLLKSSSTPLLFLNFHFHLTITLQKKEKKRRERKEEKQQQKNKTKQKERKKKEKQIFFSLPSKTMGCFSGRLMSTANDQKLFCKLCSPFCCSFNEFVEEKVISLSYSSAILTPPPKYWIIKCPKFISHTDKQKLKNLV